VAESGGLGARVIWMLTLVKTCMQMSLDRCGPWKIVDAVVVTGRCRLHFWKVEKISFLPVYDAGGKDK